MTHSDPQAAAPPGRRSLLLILGTLTALTPFSIDMYLPALPAINADLNAAPGRAELSVASFLVGFALGQLLVGPLSDRYGRRPPVIIGMGLYVLTCVGCALASSAEALIVWRFLQALTVCAGAVCARAVARDLFPPTEMARVFSLLMLITGVGPIVAPILGGHMMLFAPWQAIFWVLAGLGAIMLVASWLKLPESLDRSRARKLSFGSALRGYGFLLRDRQFVAFVLVGGFTFGGAFAYIGGSAAAFITGFGLEPDSFSWIFGVNATAMVILSQINARLVRRLQPLALLRGAALVQALGGAAMVLAALLGAGLATYLVALAVSISTLGIIAPNTMALSLAPHGERAGAAAALLGTIQFSMGGLAAAMVGLLGIDPIVAMAAVCAGCWLLALIIATVWARMPNASA